VVFVFRLCAAVLCLCCISQAQFGARTVARPLDKLVDESALIVRGYVVSAEIQPHPELNNLNTVVVSMRITDTYKGTSRKSLVFRQYVWNAVSPDAASGYGKGQELILLLRPVSEYGLTSPAGLEQGRFTVSAQARNREVLAVNGRGNAGLFDHLKQEIQARGLQVSPRLTALADRQQTGAVRVEDLEDLIRVLVRKH
jgi:hypothetical protein